MRRPISRVRSVTDSSMMFMMPMPPTSSDTPATLASSSVIVRLDALERLRQLLERHLLEPGHVAGDRPRDSAVHALAERNRCLRADDEVVRGRLGDAVTLAQELRDAVATRVVVSPADRDVIVMVLSLVRFSSRWTVVSGT